VGGKFALLVHSRPGAGISPHQNFGSNLLARLAGNFSFLHPPAKISETIRLTSNYGSAEGLLLSVNFSPAPFNRLADRYITKRVASAVRLAEKKGVNLIGLGLLDETAAAAVTALARILKPAVTTGQCYIIAAALEGSQKVLEWMGIALEDAEVLILGATGPSGSACARLLARDGVNYITLVADDKYRQETLARLIFYEYGVACKVTSQLNRSARRADLIINTGDRFGLALDFTVLKPGAVVYDLAGTFKYKTSPLPPRKDIFIIEGSLIATPGQSRINTGLDFPPGFVPPAMVETMVLALERRFESYSLSRELRVEKIDEIWKMAQKHGFKTEGFLIKGRCIRRDEFAGIKEFFSQPVNRAGERNGRLLYNQQI